MQCPCLSRKQGCSADRKRFFSAMLDVANGAVLLDVHVQPVGQEVLGDHHARLDDPTLLRQIFLAKVLGARLSAYYWL